MTENTHALEHWLNLQAKDAVRWAVNSIHDDQMNRVWLISELQEATMYIRDECGQRDDCIFAASLALRLAAIAHRESVQGEK